MRPNLTPIAGLGLATALAALGSSLAASSLPAIARSLQADHAVTQWVLIAYLLGMTSTSLVWGRVGDMFGPKRTLQQGIWVFAGASLACALSPNSAGLILARALQGVGASAILALGLVLAVESAPNHKVGRSIGLMGTASALGTAIGPTLGGMLVAGPGWRSSFIVVAVFALLALGLLRSASPITNATTLETRRFDTLGMVWISTTITMLTLSLTLRQHHLANAALLAGALVGLDLLRRRLARMASPIIDLNTLAAPGRVEGLISGMAVSAILMASLVVGPYYLSGVLNLDGHQLGLAMSAGPLVVMLLGAPAGHLVDGFGARCVLMLGLAIAAIGAIVFSQIEPGLGLAAYVLALITLTAGYALFQVANNASIMSHVAVEERGVISALLNLSRNVGLIVGTATTGLIFRLSSSGYDLSEASPQVLTHGAQSVFGVAFALLLATLILNARLWKSGGGCRASNRLTSTA